MWGLEFPHSLRTKDCCPSFPVAASPSKTSHIQALSRYSRLRALPGETMPLLGFIQRPPLHRHGLYTSTPGFPLRFGAIPMLRTCSVLVVLPDLDGLLRVVLRRFVAPCCRPWGSRRFGLFISSPRCRGFPAVPCPSKFSPRRQLRSCHHESIPSRRYFGFVSPCGGVAVRPTSGSCSAVEFVVSFRRCHRGTPVTSLGLFF